MIKKQLFNAIPAPKPNLIFSNAFPLYDQQGAELSQIIRSLSPTFHSGKVTFFLPKRKGVPAHIEVLPGSLALPVTAP